MQTIIVIFLFLDMSEVLHLRIEVHFFRLHLEMKGHLSRVNPVKREVLLKDLHATSVLSFPNANAKSVLESLYLCLSDAKPINSRKKSMSIFPSRDHCLSWENICHSFLMRHCRQIPWKCKYWSLFEPYEKGVNHKTHFAKDLRDKGNKEKKKET